MNTGKFHDCTAVLFDYGGTLDSDGQHWLTRFFTLYDNAGFSIPRTDITRAFYYAVDTCYADLHVATLGLRSLIDHHVHLQFRALGIKDKQKEKQLAETFHSDCQTFFRDRLRVLQRMKTAFRLGIVSNFYGNLATVCREAQLSEFFEVIIDSNRVGFRKPDPRIFLLALSLLGLPGRQVIFVGDSYERDMIPAMKAQMRTIWLNKPDREPGQGPQETWVDASISRLSDLEELLQ